MKNTTQASGDHSNPLRPSIQITAIDFDAVRLALRGEIVGATHAQALRGLFRALIGLFVFRGVEFDFQEVTAIDTVAIAAIASAWSTARRRGIEFALINVPLCARAVIDESQR